MQRAFFLLLLLIAANGLYAQEKRVEQFINAIYKDIVPIEYKYYYLLDIGEATHVVQFFENFKFQSDLMSKDSAFSKDIIAKFNSIDTPILWSKYSLKDAVIIPNSKADSISADWRTVQMIDFQFYEKHKDSLKKAKAYNEGYAPVDFKWSKRKKMKVLNAYTDSLEQSIPLERNNYFKFSRPVFTDDDKYAIIWYGADDHDYCLCVYRREQNGVWKILSKIFCIC